MATNSTSTVSYEAVILTSLSTIICVGGFIGNVTIATITLSKTRTRSTATKNLFVLNLAISNLAIIMITIPYNLVDPYISWERFGVFANVGCKYLLMPVMEHFAGVCVLTHTAVGLARYLVVNGGPSRQWIHNKKYIRIIICVIWVISFLVLSASLMGLFAEFKLEFDQGYLKCKLDWISPFKRKLYRVIAFIMTYVIPMVVTGFSYFRIHTIVFQSLQNVHSHLSQDMLITRRRKKQRMDTILMTNYIIFAITTLPFQVFMFSVNFNLIPTPFPHGKLTFNILLMIFYTQVITNPFVLFYMSEDYRKVVYQLPICCCLSLPKMRDLSMMVSVSFRGYYNKRKISKSSKFNSKLNSSRKPLVDDKHASCATVESFPGVDRKKWESNESSLDKMSYMNSIYSNGITRMDRGKVYGRSSIPHILDNIAREMTDKSKYNKHLGKAISNKPPANSTTPIGVIPCNVSSTSSESLERIDSSFDGDNNKLCNDQSNLVFKDQYPPTYHDVIKNSSEMNCEVNKSNLYQTNHRYLNGIETDKVRNDGYSHVPTNIDGISQGNEELTYTDTNGNIIESTNNNHISLDNNNKQLAIMDGVRSRKRSPSTERLELSFYEDDYDFTSCNLPNVTAYYDDGTIMYFYDPIMGCVSLAHDSGRETII